MGKKYLMRKRNGRRHRGTHRIAMGLGVCVFFANFLCGNVVLAENETLAENVSEVQNDLFIPMDMVVEYWGEQLTENERLIYNQMLLDALSQKRNKVCVSYEMPHIWDLSEEEIAGMVANMVARAYSAFTYDYPLYRPASYSYQYEVVGFELTIWIEVEEFYDQFWVELPKVQEEIAGMEEKIRMSFLERMIGDASSPDLDQIFVDLSKADKLEEFLLLECIYEAVIERIVYSFDVDDVITEYVSTSDQETFGVSAAVLDRFHHHGVCSAYSGLFQILCTDLGISCIQVCNNGTSVASAHSYNYVRVGDDWYLVDCTWGDEQGNVNWDSFLCGNKVSLDGRRVGTQLANPYVVDPFCVPLLTDTFYFSLTNVFIRENEKRSVIYDLCQDGSVRDKKELVFYPKSDAVVTNSVMDSFDPSKIVITSRYISGELLQEYAIATYPIYEYENQCLRLVSLTPYIKISAIPYVIADEYCFGYEGSDVLFAVSSEGFETASAHYEDFSLNLITDLTKVKGMLSGGFIRQETFRKRSEAVYAVAFPEWSGFYEESQMKIRIPVYFSSENSWMHPDCVVTTKDVLYAVGMKENGELCVIGEQSMEPGEGNADGYLVIPANYKIVLLYETEWKENSDYRLLIIGILIVTLVIVMILWRCRKRVGKRTRG